MRSIILLIIISGCLTGCYKDSIFKDITETTDSPAEIGTVNIEGITKSVDGVILANTSVIAHQKDTKIGTVYSDDRGYYSTRSLPLDPDEPVTLEFINKDRDVKYRRFNIESSEKLISNPILGKSNEDNITNNSTPFSNPADTNLVKIWGYAKLANGTPVRGVRCIATWEFWKIGDRGLYVISGSTDFSDEDGYFELLVPRDEDIFFRTFYMKYPNDLFGQCHIQFQNLEENELIKWDYNKLGVLSEDTRVLLREDIELDLIMITVKGRALKCDGSPITKGSLKGYLGIVLSQEVFPRNSYIDSDYTFGPNGEFEFYLEGCRGENDNFGIRIVVESDDFEGRYEQAHLENTENLPDIRACFDHRIFPHEFNMKLGDDPEKVFMRGGDNPYSGINEIKASFSNYGEELGESVFLGINHIQLGIVPISYLKMWKLRKRPDRSYWEVYETTFEAKPEDVVLNITKIEDRYVYGTINGNVDTPDGNKSLEISFKVYNK